MTDRQLDFLRNPAGDPALARRYLARAGYTNGRYTGPAVTMLGSGTASAGT